MKPNFMTPWLNNRGIEINGKGGYFGIWCLRMRYEMPEEDSIERFRAVFYLQDPGTKTQARRRQFLDHYERFVDDETTYIYDFESCCFVAQFKDTHKLIGANVEDHQEYWMAIEYEEVDE